MPFLIPTEPTPVTNRVVVEYPLEKVKWAIRSLIRDYPQYFIVKKNGINDEFGTYVFDRPKGIDTPTIRITLSSEEEGRTIIETHCSTSSFTSTAPDLQVAITEVQNILIAKLKGNANIKIEQTIKDNNSGNGIVGHLKSIGCIIFFGIVILGFLATILRVLLN